MRDVAERKEEEERVRNGGRDEVMDGNCFRRRRNGRSKRQAK